MSQSAKTTDTASQADPSTRSDTIGAALPLGTGAATPFSSATTVGMPRVTENTTGPIADARKTPASIPARLG